MEVIWQDIKALYRKYSVLLKRWGRENRAGIYITVIFHLTVIIVLLIARIGTLVNEEKSFVFDFSREEAREEEIKKDIFRQDISRQLDEMIAAAKAQSSEGVRNIAVDAGSTLKDDRGTDADKLYEDARRLADRSDRDHRQAIEEDAREDRVDLGQARKKKEDAKEYKGPSVVSYRLDGRKASHLDVPAYRCMGGGDVTVIIKVNTSGSVTDAKILDAVSSDDRCLRNYAIRAARLSRFGASRNAPPSQTGEIVYRFIAQ